MMWKCSEVQIVGSDRKKANGYDISEEFMGRLYSWSACYHSVHNLISSCLICKRKRYMCIYIHTHTHMNHYLTTLCEYET